jgi:hypothetical protein
VKEVAYNCNLSPGACQELSQACVSIGRTEERCHNLEVWQENQNGHLARIDERLDKFLWALVAILVTSLGTLIMAVLGHLSS